jgi:hypothetical protein
MSLKANLELVRERIGKALRKSGRREENLKLLAVCKEQPAEVIREAYRLGLRIFGENRVQEAEKHQQELRATGDSEWHFIGRIQKNKINRILALFDTIETADSVKNLEHISKRVDQTVELMLEINIGEERNKTGFTIDGLRKALNYIAQINHIRIVGLMTIPPLRPEPEDRRIFFSRVRELGDEINRLKIPGIEIRELSMGMSDDFEVAIEEGATIVRIGTALFGERKKQGEEDELFD